MAFQWRQESANSKCNCPLRQAPHNNTPLVHPMAALSSQFIQLFSNTLKHIVECFARVCFVVETIDVEYVFKAKFLKNKREIEENMLQRPLVRFNSNLFRPANFANRSSFGQVRKMAGKGECRL